MEIAALGLKVTGVTDVDRAASALDGLADSSGRAENSQGGLSSGSERSSRAVKSVGVESQRTSRSVDGLARAARRAGGVLAAAFGVRELINYADTWTNLTSRVELSISAQENAADVMSRLSDIARQTFSTFQSTAEAFALNSVTLRALGKTTQEQLNYTEALNNALAVSGAEGERAQMVQNSLSRAMAEGALRGEDLNNVLNSGSRIAELLADELDVNITSLRGLAAEGKITGDVLYTALTTNMRQLAEESAGMGSTVRGAMRILSNSILETIGVMNQQYEAGAQLSGGILAMADAISDTDFTPLLKAVGTLALVVGGRLTAAAYGAAASFSVAQAEAVRYQVALARMAGVSTVAAARLTALSVASRTATAALALVGGPIGAAVLAAGAIYSFREELGLVPPDAGRASAAIDRLVGSMDNLSVERAAQELRKTRDEFDRAKNQVAIFEQQINNLNDVLERQPGFEKAEKLLEDAKVNFAEGTALVNKYSSAIADLQDRLAGTDFPGLTGDIFEVPETSPGGADSAAVASVSTKELDLLREHNALIQEGVGIQEAAQRMDERRLAMKLEEQGLTESQIETYVRLSAAIDSATEAYRREQESANFETDIDILRQQNELIKEGVSVREAARIVDEARLAASLESQGATQAQAESFIELSRAIEEAGEREQELSTLAMRLEEIRSEVDPAYAAMVQFNSAIDELHQMVDAGLIDSEEFDSLHDSLKSIYDLTGDVSGGFGEMAKESLKSLRIMQRSFDAGSKGYDQLNVAIQALNAVQAVNAVIKQASDGDVYTAMGRAATMAAAMASLGQSVGSLGGSFTDTAAQRQERQGTGSVLGMAEEKSESIERSSDITATATSELVGINRDMLTALRGLREGISGATGQIIRGASGLDFDYEGQIRVTENIFGGITRITDQLGALGGGLMEQIGKILGGSSKVTDEGVRILGGAMSDMMEGAVLQAFQETQSKRYAWSSTRTSTAFEGLDDNVNAQFQLVFSGIASSVMAGAEALGLSAKEIDRAINEFEVSTQLISLKDLDAQEQQAELEAVFSSIFDGLTDVTAPFLRDLQNVGEGLGETLARVATNVQVTDEAILRLGFNAERLGAEQFSELSTALIDASGGLEQFLSGMGNFVDRFASEAHQFEIAQNDMARAFDQIGLAVPETREQMWSLMQTLDANTDAGRRQIAMILELSATADDYYRSLEQQQREAMRAMEEQQREAIRGVEGIARALQSEISGIGSAAQRLRGDLGEGSSARNDAIELLRSAMTSGDLAGTGRAAQTAAQISASDFSSAEEFRREQARTLFLLDSLEREGNQQLSTAEQSLNVLENIDGGIDTIATTMEDLADAIRYDRPDDIVQFSAPQKSGNQELQRAQTANDELIKEIKDIKNYIRQTMKNTGESRDQLRNWNRQGLPEERELV